SSLLFGVGALDAFTYLAAGVALLGAVVLASLVPARRAARTDPCQALRAESSPSLTPSARLTLSPRRACRVGARAAPTPWRRAGKSARREMRRGCRRPGHRSALRRRRRAPRPVPT